MTQMDDWKAEAIELARDEPLAQNLDVLDRQDLAQARVKGVIGSSFGTGLLGSLGIGAALVGVMSTSAFASTPTDIQILQTAASIEVLAVATYNVALTLPFIGGASANPVISGFAKMTMAQHQQHLVAFNAVIKSLGGKVQENPDPVLLKVVNNAKPTLTSAAAVVNLALELEQGAAETYVNDISLISNKNKSSRATFGSIMGVEAQHAAILRAVSALLAANAPQLIALSPTVVNSLPAVAGSLGFPNAFFPTNQARPATEGAL